MPTLLVIDDDPAVRASLAATLREDAHEVLAAGSVAEGRRLAAEGPDAVLLDVYLGDGDGLSLLGELRQADPERPVIVFSGAADIPTALRAVRNGAWDFLEKPLSHAKVRLTVKNALAARESDRSGRDRRAADLARATLIGSSERLAEVARLLARAAPARVPVLITGESGTGKEIAARRLHLLSPRWSRPLVQVNCAALPRDLLESELFGHARGAFTGAVDRRGHLLEADGGTLFLDEIGDLDVSLQAKLLRMLEEGTVTRLGESRPRKVDVRIVAATSRDLAAQRREGRFRDDLWFRLAGVVVEMPALRDRPEDLAPLVEHLVQRFCAENGRRVPVIDADAVAALRDHGWPGNVRELLHVVGRTLLLADGDHIERFLVDGSRADAPVTGRLADVKRELLRRHLTARLAAHGGSRPALARELGILLNNLYRLLRVAGVEVSAAAAPRGPG